MEINLAQYYRSLYFKYKKVVIEILYDTVDNLYYLTYAVEKRKFFVTIPHPVAYKLLTFTDELELLKSAQELIKHY